MINDMSKSTNELRNRKRELAWGIAYCLAYDRDIEGPVLMAIRELVLQDQMPRGVQGDEASIIAEAARQIVSDETDPTTYTTKHHLRESRLSQLSDLLGGQRVALVMGGATKIKQYVFESVKLAEVRGASALLDRINLRDARALFSKTPAWLTELHTRRDLDEQDISETRLLTDNVRRTFQEISSVGPLDCEECIIYSNGGELLAFAPLKLAAFLAEAIERFYTIETMTGNSVTVWRACSLLELRFGLNPLEVWVEDLTANDSLRELLVEYGGESDPQAFGMYKSFGEITAALAQEKLRRRDGNQVDSRLLKPPPLFETITYAKRCSSCEIRVAVVLREVGEDQRWLCEPCARKSAFGQRAKRDLDEQINWFTDAGFEWRPLGAEAWGNRFDQWLNEEKHSDLRRSYYADIKRAFAPKDLEDIAEAAKPEGFIGVVYADGNNMGAILEELETPADYQMFAEAVYDAIRESSFTAIATHLRPCQKKGKWIHPFEVLSIGGDDVFMIVPAQAALPIAITITELVEARLSCQPLTQINKGYTWGRVHRITGRSDLEPPIPQSKVSLSAGAVIAECHTPISLLRNLADELLKSAKKKAKKLKQKETFYGATIDFVSLKSIGMIANNVLDFRKSALRRNDNHLTAKPYTSHELKQLLRTAGFLKGSGFPRTQLYRLRKQIEKGWLASSVDYLYLRERLPKAHARAVREALDEEWIGYQQDGPGGRVGDIGLWLRHRNDDWEMKEDEWETMLGDLAEIYEFVAEKGQTSDK